MTYMFIYAAMVSVFAAFLCLEWRRSLSLAVRYKGWYEEKRDHCEKLEDLQQQVLLTECQRVPAEPAPAPPRFRFNVIHETVLPREIIAESDTFHEDGTLEFSLSKREGEAFPVTVAVFAPGQWQGYTCEKITDGDK